MRVALASCRVLPEPDHDESLLLSMLRDRGAEVGVVAWDDPDARFDAWDLVVLRSTWNYHQDLEAFLAWVRKTAAVTRLSNPAHVVEANARKTYLRDLETRGIAIVPTEFVMSGTRVDLTAVTQARGWGDIVVKPTVSAGSFRTRRFRASERSAAQTFLDELGRDRDAMVQAWMPEVEGSGERALVWIDGEVTHAIRKEPRFADGHESVSSVPVADDERALAAKVVAASAAPGELLYGRVDMIRDGGVLRIMELELIEPSLFLQQSEPARERFADAIVARAR